MTADTSVRAASQAELSSKLTQLRRTYVKRLGSVLISARRLETLLESGFAPAADIQNFYRISHDYAGSGATFGFPQISIAARSLHTELKDFLSADQSSAQPRFQVLEKMRAFESACRAAVDAPPEETRVTPQEIETVDPKAKYIGIIAGKSEDAPHLVTQLRQYGYRADLYKALKEQDANAKQPDLFIACATAPPDAGTRGAVPRPLIVVDGADAFDDRLAAIRAGASAYFTGPPDLLKIIEKIETLLAGNADSASYSILIVDDDPILSQLYEHALRSAGMKTTAVTSARDCLTAMADQAFDLVLMDYAMPHCDGRELATIIRQQDAFVSVPIVFMSAKPDIEGMLIDRGLGIDAYLTKPFAPEQMVSLVRSRARRASELHALMVRDSFTGLLNHATFIETLTTEHHAMQRNGRNIAYAMIDLDKFKSINDTFGHAAGDTVIKSLARLLKYQLRRSDIIGRCGGEEFGIIMPDCDLENAQRILGNLLAKFRDLVFDFGGTERRVTFSGGLLQLNGDNPLDAMIASVDKALYRAKENGRNQIVLA